MGSRTRTPPKRRRPPGRKTQRDPNALTPFQELFVEEYVYNGGNATAAYRSAHNGKVKDTTAASEACTLLRHPKIRARVEQRRAERFARCAMQGDEAIAHLSMRARAKLSDAYDEQGKLLPIAQWPEELQTSVRRLDKDGAPVLVDTLKAAELMAIATGRLKSSVDLLHKFDHAKYLAGMDEDPDTKGGK